jgi:hypothetical protein
MVERVSCYSEQRGFLRWKQVHVCANCKLELGRDAELWYASEVGDQLDGTLGRVVESSVFYVWLAHHIQVQLLDC